MGSVFEYITIQKAAEALKISERQIYRYISAGHVGTIKDGQHQLVSRKDIASLVQLKKKGDLPTVNKITVAKLHAKVQVLEKQMGTVMRILDLRYEPLELSAHELQSLYEMASWRLKDPWSPHEEEMWCDTFTRIRIEDVEKLAEVVPDPHPWRPLYALAKAMLENPHNADLKLQLSAGKNNLEKIAFIWAQTIEQDDSKKVDRLMKEDDKQVRKVSRKIERTRAKK